MTTAADRLERHYRRLLRCYPRAWRQQHEDEVVGVLLDQAEAAGRATVTVGAAVDLVGHGLEERAESLLRWWPRRWREQTAVVALVAAAGLSLLLLVGEVIGAQARPPAEEIHHYGQYFISGPFLTVGVGLYLALMSAALLVVLGRGPVARLLVVAAVGDTLWMRHSWGYPLPQLQVQVLLGGLALLAALATVRPSRRVSRGMVGLGAGFVVALGVGILLSRPVLGWSVGTMSTSGNVAFAVLATVLPFVGGAAVVVAALEGHRHPGWPAAIAVAAVPVVLFCTIVSQAVNPVQAGPRTLIPLGYVLVVGVVAAGCRRGRRRAVARG